ncbi:hypothetical protein ACFVUY_38695 [Kitasatospora sp. NPDC058063]|uniref:hypothetical protein n=1 Tax=unclassified Kitasatospora TaxID=2633591 RepID=UPI0035DCDD9C
MMTTAQTSRGDLNDKFGDLIDDRVAEAVDALLDDSLDAAVAGRLGRYRRRSWLLMVVLVAIVSGLSVALVDSPGPLAAMWVAAAVICACQAHVCRPYGSWR